MEEEISRMRNFLADFNNEQVQSPTSEEIALHRIGNYALDPEDVTGQVIDWVLNYLENRACPYSLAVSVAKTVSQQINTYVSQSETGDQAKTFNAADLYAEAIGKISSVCSAFSNQDNLESICSIKYATSTFAIKNKRRKMEDRHIIHHDLNALLDLKDAPYQSYYAVFDGHSGIDAACYASAQLHVNIAKHPDFLSDTRKAIIEGYQITDLNFLNKCNKWNIKSGSTAVCAFVRDNTIFLSWLGDSQGVLVKGGLPVIITSPHKPDREDERHRIEKLGGHISHMGTWRVNGLLAVTRAIGDPDQKPYISSEPELEIINLDGTEDFLILACDGLWDGISPEDATGILYRYLADSPPDEPLDAVAAKLVHQAKLQGSEDNITAVVVFLRNIKDIKENAVAFLSNPLHCNHSHDFMALNGNMKMFNMDPNSDSAFSKPTVLELNAASSKKLKNAANVMSSAGFGSASYSYQYVENPVEGPFQTASPSIVDSSQTVYVPQAVHTASCFAPEATALSELPTPPIDDILASQQFENFYATDLYKELNSVQTSQDSELNVKNVTDINVGSNELLSPSVDVSSQPVCDIVADVSNMSLHSVENNSSTNASVLSPHEAVGIASTVVSSTIETAVKCLSDETQESAPVQSPKKLNPYAKPFVMKSFFNPEMSDSMSSSFIGDELETPSICGEPDTKLDSQIITEMSTESSVSQSVSTHEEIISNVVMDKPCTENLNLDNHTELHLSTFSENISDKVSTKMCHSSVNKTELPNQLVNDTIVINSAEDQPLQNIGNRDLLEIQESGTVLDECQKSETSSAENVDTNQEITQAENKLSDVTDFLSENFGNVNLNSEFNDVGENIPASLVNISPTDKEKSISPVSSECLVSPYKILDKEPVTELVNQSVTSFKEPLSEQNQNLENISVGLTSEHSTSDITENKSKHEIVESIKSSENYAISQSVVNVEKESPSLVSVEAKQSQVKELTQEFVAESSINFEEVAMPEHNQNSDLANVSKGLTSEIIEAEIKSKCEEIQKSIVDAVEKSESSETPSLVEQISLINIKDELIPSEAEAPSDPSAEDSRVESVAVDLKSLPEGIPEAEGVTEDIDSDSEKDGGWSYMKGNTVTGSKSKPDEKTKKAAKSNELKSNVTSKTRRDVSKPTLDVKSRMKNVSTDKTKSTLVDKSKSVPLDKTKNVVADKTKNIASIDKTKTLTSADKTKMLTSADKTKTLTSADKTKTLSLADKTRRVPIEKKPDVKTRVLKSSVVSATTKVTADKANRVTTTSSIKKEVSETTKTTSTISKLTRPSTLSRTSNTATKSVVSTVATDRSAASNKASAKLKGSSLLENKTTAKITTTSSTLSRGLAIAQSKSSTVSTRTTLTRPATTVSSKITPAAKPTLQKNVAGELKQKLPSSTSVSTTKKPITTTAKKSDVKVHYILL